MQLLNITVPLRGEPLPSEVPDGARLWARILALDFAFQALILVLDHVARMAAQPRENLRAT